MQRRLITAFFSVLLVAMLAGCHGSSTKNQSPSSGHPTNAPTATCTIPQNNGGDHDADNNGGPDDGDGCDV
jgi:hypothetical protein